MVWHFVGNWGHLGVGTTALDLLKVITYKCHQLVRYKIKRNVWKT
jgi:hypothetical protein